MNIEPAFFKVVSLLKFRYLILALLFLSNITFGQKQMQAQLQRIPTIINEGLSYNRVNCMYKDFMWPGTNEEIKETYTKIEPGIMVKASSIKGIWNGEGAQVLFVVSLANWHMWWIQYLIFMGIIGVLFGLYFLRMNAIKRHKVELEKQVSRRIEELNQVNEALMEQKEELDDQSDYLNEVNNTLEKMYMEVKDSINAAQIIQKSILPNRKLIKKHLSKFFILNKPKDVVSGDFYWFDEKDGQILIAVVDCTGHGVPGAFMSINGYHLLNKAVDNHRHLIASKILDKLNKSVIKDLHSEEHKNGMDISLCILDKKKMIMQFAGAMSQMYIIRQNELIQVKGDRINIGLVIDKKVQRFTNQEIPIEAGDMIYMFSDGYVDQIGGPDNNKFMYNRFRELLLRISDETPRRQRILLDRELEAWIGNGCQIDDVLILGFKIT